MGECAHIWEFAPEEPDEDGYVQPTDYPTKRCRHCGAEVYGGLAYHVDDIPHCPDYSTDIREACKVVEHVTSITKHDFQLNKYISGDYVASFKLIEYSWRDLSVSARDPSAPRAICFAALKVAEYWIDEKRKLEKMENINE